MLAVVSEQFPRGGAITIGAIGGVGMLSAGLLGGPGIGFEQDHYASEKLKQSDPAVFDRYKSPTENEFLAFKTVGLDGSKVGVLDDGGKEAQRALDVLKKDPRATPEAVANQQKLVDWWNDARTTAEQDKNLVTDASLYGGRMALQLTAAVPALVCLGLPTGHHRLFQDPRRLPGPGPDHQARGSPPHDRRRRRAGRVLNGPANPIPTARPVLHLRLTPPGPEPGGVSLFRAGSDRGTREAFRRDDTRYDRRASPRPGPAGRAVASRVAEPRHEGRN